MRRIILIFLIFFLLLSCSNDESYKNTTSKNPVEKNNELSENNFVEKQNGSEDLSKHKILNKISDIPQNYLPIAVKKYLNNNDSVKMELFDYNSAGFIYSKTSNFTQIKVQYLKNHTDLELLGFFYFKKDKFGYKNYFYFIQSLKGSWSNVTQLFVSKSLTDYVSDILNTDLYYQKQSGYYSYTTDYTNKAMLFDFSNESKIYIFKNDQWQSVGEIRFSEGLFIPEIEQKNDTYPAKMLNTDELDACKHYHSLKNALSDSENVYVADFSSLGIDFLSKDVAKLRRLQILILNDNSLKILPDEITELPKLQILRSNNNKLESLPPQIGYMKNLQEISVSNNNLQYIPVSFAKAQSLQILNLDNNSLNSIVIDWSNMDNLVVLNVSNNNLTKLPTTIGNLKNLISLNISNNPIESLPDQIYNLEHLEYIDVRNTNLPEEQILKLMNMSMEITVIDD